MKDTGQIEREREGGGLQTEYLSGREEESGSEKKAEGWIFLLFTFSLI